MEPGKVIKLFRETKGLSSVELASEAGISPTLLSLLESGIRQPTKQTSSKLAKALEIPEEALVTIMAGGQPSSNTRVERLSKAVAAMRRAEERLRRELSTSNWEVEDGNYGPITS